MRGVLCGALLVVLTVLSYLNSLDVPFVFDDALTIVKNVPVRTGEVFYQGMLSSRHLLAITFGLNYLFGGLDVWSYHVVNIVIHALNALLVFGVVLRLDLSRLVSFTASAIWALHPIQTESVSYISSRSETLSALFVFLGLWIWLGRESPWFRWGPVSVMTIAGLMTKETAIVLPFLLAAIVLLRGNAAALFIPLGCVGFAQVAGLLPRAGYSLHDLAVWLGTQAWMFWVSMWQVVVPRLSVDWGAVAVTFADWRMFVGSLGILALAGLCLWLRKRNFAVAFAIFAALSHFAPRSIYPVNDVQVEHRMYLPLFGIAILAAMMLERMPRRGLVVAALAPALMFGTLTRNETWRSEQLLWADAVAQAPENPVAHVNLGAIHHRNGNETAALESYKLAIQYGHRCYSQSRIAILRFRCLDVLADAQTKVAVMAESKGDLDNAEPILLSTLGLIRNYGPAAVALTRIYAKTGRNGEALTIADASIQSSAGAGFTQRGDLFFYRGIALCGLGYTANANESFNKARSEGSPNWAECRGEG
jgi:tetratricopeptide (TPR) repeat protein